MLRQVRPRRVRRQHRRGADRDRRALRHRRRLGGRGRAGRDVRDHVLRRAARRRALHRRRRRPRAARPGSASARRQHLGRRTSATATRAGPGARDVGDAQRAPPLASDEFAGVVVAAGADARARDDLDQAALRRRRPGEAQSIEQAQRDKIRFLEAKFAPLWGTMGAVAEAFGARLSPMRATSTRRSTGTAPRFTPTTAAPRSRPPSSSATSSRGAARSRADPVAARRDIDEAIARLQQAGRDPADDRARGLLGSAYKRLVMVEGRAADAARRRGRHRCQARPPPCRGRAHAGERWSRCARWCCTTATPSGWRGEANADNLFYPAKNGISAELRLAFLERRPAELAVERMRAVAGIAGARGERAARLLVGRRPDRAARAGSGRGAAPGRRIRRR